VLATTNVFGQVDSLKTDSIKAGDERTINYLKNLVEEAVRDAQDVQTSYDQLEIDELMVNATISKPGNDFFYYYSTGFVWPDATGDFIVEITERPFRFNQTQITIKVNDLEVFQNMLQPRASYLEDLAVYAQQVTANYIINYQQIMKELDGDDRTGSGIF
jgi:curli production assembly/transport component CsgE